MGKRLVVAERIKLSVSGDTNDTRIMLFLISFSVSFHLSHVRQLPTKEAVGGSVRIHSPSHNSSFFGVTWHESSKRAI